MTDSPTDSPGRATPPVTALPSVGARIFAFVCIALAGTAGAVIGYAFVDLQCRGDCTLQTGLATLVGGVAAATGTAVVVVLTLRAMGEWKTIKSPGGAPTTSDEAEDNAADDNSGGEPLPRVR